LSAVRAHPALREQAHDHRRHGKAGHRLLPEVVSRMRPRRALALTGASSILALGLLAGCGGDSGGSAAADPAAATPAAASVPQISRPTAPGDVVRPGPGTPKAVAQALTKGQAIVVAFLMSGTADDDAVRQALRTARGSSDAKGVKMFTYTLGQSKRFGDLPELLDVTVTPSVAVIGRDGRLNNLFRGLTDAELIRQAMSDAKSSTPARPVSDGNQKVAAAKG
jgi:hypothetical protein